MKSEECLLNTVEIVVEYCQKKGRKGKVTFYKKDDLLIIIDYSKDSKVIYFANIYDKIFINANTLEYDFKTQVKVYEIAKKQNHQPTLKLFGFISKDSVSVPCVQVVVNQEMIEYVQNVYENCKTNITPKESTCCALFNYSSGKYLMFARKIYSNLSFTGAIFKYDEETNMFFDISISFKHIVFTSIIRYSINRPEIKLYNSDFKIAYDILKSLTFVRNGSLNIHSIISLNYALSHTWFESLLKTDKSNAQYVMNRIETYGSTDFSKFTTIYDFYRTTNKTAIKAIRENGLRIDSIEKIISKANSNELAEIFTKKIDFINKISNTFCDYHLDNIYSSIIEHYPKYISSIRIIDYIEYLYSYQYLEYEEATRSYSQYLTNLFDMTMVYEKEITKEILFPKQLLFQLCKIQRENKILTQEILNKKIEKWCNKFVNLTFEYNDFIIKPIQDLKELMQEGDKMHNCVGSYARKYSNGDSIIFSIRSNQDLNKPLCTIEYIPILNRVVQVKEPCNQSPNKKTQLLIEEWCHKFKIDIDY